MEGAGGELAYGFGAGTDGCDSEIHLLVRVSLVVGLSPRGPGRLCWDGAGKEVRWRSGFLRCAAHDRTVSSFGRNDGSWGVGRKTNEGKCNGVVVDGLGSANLTLRKRAKVRTGNSKSEYAGVLPLRQAQGQNDEL